MVVTSHGRSIVQGSITQQIPSLAKYIYLALTVYNITTAFTTHSSALSISKAKYSCSDKPLALGTH